MSKKIRQLVVLLVVVVLMGAMTVALTLIPSGNGGNTSSDPASSSSGSAKTEYLYQHEETEVKAFTLTNEHGTFKFTGGYNADQKRMNYQIIGYEGIDFLDSMPGKVAAYAEELEIIRWIGEKEDLSEYGLMEKDAVRLQATYTDGSNIDITIGGTLNSNKEQRYAVETGKNKVFVVEADELRNISAKTLLPSLLLSIQAMDAEENLSAPDFNLVRISGRGHKIPLEIRRVDQLKGIDLSSPLANAVYYIQENVKMPVVPEATTTFLSDMCLIQSTGVVAIKPTAAQKSQYGFDNPIVLEVEVVASTNEDGTPKQIDDYKVVVGKIDTDNDVAYAMVPERDVIYEIDPDCIKALTMTSFDMREKVLYLLAGNSIKDMTVTTNGKVYPFIRERIKNESVNSATGETVVTYDYKAYYNNELMTQFPLFYSQFLAAYTEAPITEATKKGELLFQADITHFEDLSKGTTKICIYACEDERRVLYEVDGELLGYTRMTWMNKVRSDVEDLIQGKKLTVTY